MAKTAIYTKKYIPNGEVVSIRGFEIPVPLPARPPRSKMHNYGKPIEQQKFRREQQPTDKEWMAWDNDKKMEYAEDQWHKRIHGEWWIIKDTEVYVPGRAWFFFNYWHMNDGKKPAFRMEAIDYYLVDEFVEQESWMIGKYVIKSRREGATEKELCANYDAATRYFGSDVGNMNTTEPEAKKNYLRLIVAHKRMRPWFRPSTRDDDAQEVLTFDYTDMMQDGEPEPLLSSISYKPTKLRSYDGWKLRRIHWDEIGKIKPSDIDVEAQWGILKESLALNNGINIVGKAALTTTVENFASGATVKVCTSLWDASNPAILDEFGRTVSGMVRYFRDYLYGADVDEFGFPKIEEAKRIRNATIIALTKAGKLDELGAYKRKFPETITEALAIPESMCVLHPVLIDRQLSELKMEQELRGLGDPTETKLHEVALPVKGDLVWEDKFMGNVKWIPNPTSGRFLISQHPISPNKHTIANGMKMPGNISTYSFGGDPVDHKRPVKGDGSDFAGAIFRNLDWSAETKIRHMDTTVGPEIENKALMQTNRFVCTYRYRPLNPKEGYEDLLKAAVYYGAPLFVETNKPGITFFFEGVGAMYYLAYKHPLIKVGAKKSDNPGMPTSQQSTQLGIDMLKTHVYEWSETYVHEDQLIDFRNFTGENAGERDLTVASWFALTNAKAVEAAAAMKKENDWSELPFALYPHDN